MWMEPLNVNTDVNGRSWVENYLEWQEREDKELEKIRMREKEGDPQCKVGTSAKITLAGVISSRSYWHMDGAPSMVGIKMCPAGPLQGRNCFSHWECCWPKGFTICPSQDRLSCRLPLPKGWPIANHWSILAQLGATLKGLSSSRAPMESARLPCACILPTPDPSPLPKDTP